MLKGYIYLILFVTFGIASTFNNYMFASIQQKEFNEIKKQASNPAIKTDATTVFKTIPYYYYQTMGIFPRYIADEFVVPSSAFEWSKDEIVKQALFEAGKGNVQSIENMKLIVSEEYEEATSVHPIINPRIFTSKPN